MCDDNENPFYNDDVNQQYKEFKNKEISNPSAPDPESTSCSPFNYPGDMQIPHPDRPYNSPFADCTPQKTCENAFPVFNQDKKKKKRRDKKWMMLILLVILILFVLLFLI